MLTAYFNDIALMTVQIQLLLRMHFSHCFMVLVTVSIRAVRVLLRMESSYSTEFGANQRWTPQQLEPLGPCAPMTTSTLPATTQDGDDPALHSQKCYLVCTQGRFLCQEQIQLVVPRGEPGMIQMGVLALRLPPYCSNDHTIPPLSTSQCSAERNGSGLSADKD